MLDVVYAQARSADPGTRRMMAFSKRVLGSLRGPQDATGARGQARAWRRSRPMRSPAALHLMLPLWAVLTSLIVTQMSVGRSLKATRDYMLGTVGGAIYGGAIAVLIPHSGEGGLAGAAGAGGGAAGLHRAPSIPA